jgi:hypothetical protein
MAKKPSIVGRRFGKWLVIGDAPSKIYKSSTQRRNVCRCDCGIEKQVANQDLLRGHSLGCRKCRRGYGSNKIIHGHARRNNTSRVYFIWCGMISRATNERYRDFKHYGGRGIKVCERWLKFENFLSDMGEAPAGLSIDRINNDGNYEPENCRWATRQTQNRNCRSNRVFTINGITGCVAALAEAFGIHHTVIRTRLVSGWSPEEAFLTPVKLYRISSRP